ELLLGKTLVSGDKWIDNPIPCDFTIMTLAPDKPEYRQCFFTILPSDMKAIALLKETIAINGTYTYENGFGDLKAEPMCFRYFPHVRTKYGLEGSGTFPDCDGFRVEREIILRRLNEK